MPVTVQYTLTFSEFREGVKAFTPRTRVWAWVLMGVLVLFGVLALALLVLNRSNIQRPAAGWMVLYAFVGFQLAGVIWQSRTRYRKAWSAHAYLRLPQNLAADETSVSVAWQTTRVQVGWQEVKAWKETPSTIALSTTIGLFILPKRCMPEPMRRGLMDLLYQKPGHGTGGFPVDSEAGRATPAKDPPDAMS